MGGDVEKSALSAYTAGSHRQEQVISEPTAVTTTKPAESLCRVNSLQQKAEIESSPSIATSKRKIEAHSSNSEITATSFDDGAETARSKFARTSTDNEQAKSSSSDTISEHISKADALAAARQRFLDRKKASQTSTDHST